MDCKNSFYLKFRNAANLIGIIIAEKRYWIEALSKIDVFDFSKSSLF